MKTFLSSLRIMKLKYENLLTEINRLNEEQEQRKSILEEYDSEISGKYDSIASKLLTLKMLKQKKEKHLKNYRLNYETQKAEAEKVKATLDELHAAEFSTRRKVDQLAEQIKEKVDKITQLESNISVRENELTRLENEIAEKLKEFNDTNAKASKII
ncbi:MAG: hypothetical protein MZV64_69750 [Ignavibacteriales bacterium]|nr:hypothetical protein [Ignavibacteriales bacterium]